MKKPLLMKSLSDQIIEVGEFMQQRSAEEWQKQNARNIEKQFKRFWKGFGIEC